MDFTLLSFYVCVLLFSSVYCFISCWGLCTNGGRKLWSLGVFYFLFYYLYILMLNFLIKQCYIYKSKLQKWIQRSGVICRCSHSILLRDEGT
jgi:hypothetical protein